MNSTMNDERAQPVEALVMTSQAMEIAVVLVTHTKGESAAERS